MPENYMLQMKRVLRKPARAGQSCFALVLRALLQFGAGNAMPHFEVTVDYYNPNIDTAEEYAHPRPTNAVYRSRPFAGGTQVLWPERRPQPRRGKGLEHIPGGGARCFACYALRLRHAAALAKQLSCECFCTTLSVSPHKNAAKLNELGQAVAEEYGVKWLPSDFKKSGRLSPFHGAERGIRQYRQDYCGCVFSGARPKRRRAKRGGISRKKRPFPAGKGRFSEGSAKWMIGPVFAQRHRLRARGGRLRRAARIAAGLRGAGGQAAAARCHRLREAGAARGHLGSEVRVSG